MAKKIYKLSVSAEIWNRACFADGDHSGLLRGDIALSNLLRVHGRAMNSGLLYAIGITTPKEFFDAQQAYEYYGFPCIASLLGYVQAVVYKYEGENSGKYESLVDDLYCVEIPTDQAIDDRFQAKLKAYPQDFAPWKPEKKR